MIIITKYKAEQYFSMLDARANVNITNEPTN